MAEKSYKMTISLNVLNHLGINLYSTIPAVISEVVANAWDADATSVDIRIEEDEISILDNGCGMSYEDLNNKYLYVGYVRREQPNEAETPIFKRRVMGRKGIGKLSLFSISDTIELQSVKDGKKNGFTMSASKIRDQLKDQEKHSGDYHPDTLPENRITINEQGTRVTIRELKRGTSTTAAALRKRLARRFSIIGAEHDFVVSIDGSPILIEDRDYFHKIQYLWYYGEGSEKYRLYCREGTLFQHEERPNKIGGNGYEVSGWIGSMARAGLMRDGLGDNLNRIVIMVRGKLAQEDILEDFVEGGMYTKYIIGEIHADFLDTDDGEDSATTSRQEIKRDDPRYVALRDWVLGELKNIQSLWTKLRNREGTEWALQIPAIKEWFASLGKDDRKHAESLFGKLNQLSIDSDAERKTLLSHAVLAFESFRFKNNLSALESVSAENMQAFSEVFAKLDDIEATLYHQIVGERLEIVKALHDKIDDNALEKVIQNYLYDHLWLLDPSWERATETPLLEQQVKTAFAGLDAELTKEEREGRFDIKYKTTSKKHVIVELKRAERSINSHDIAKQVTKYRSALRKVLIAAGKGQEPIEIVCIVGKPCSDWSDATAEQESRDSLAELHIRVVSYQELIEDSYRNYQAFLDKSDEVGRIYRLVRNIEDYAWGEA